MKRRYSKQREIILNAVLNRKDHPTAENIYNEVKEVLPNISLGTVYRNLKVLAEEGNILKIGSYIKNEHFDGRLDNHIHMICKKCGCVVDVLCNAEELINSEAIIDEDNVVDEINITLLGICSNCKEKGN